jgi:hypothetical protein
MNVSIAAANYHNAVTEHREQCRILQAMRQDRCVPTYDIAMQINHVHLLKTECDRLKGNLIRMRHEDDPQQMKLGIPLY